ncbi:PilN domain-containing protein [Patescibacteria group bacterium]
MKKGISFIPSDKEERFGHQRDDSAVVYTAGERLSAEPEVMKPTKPKQESAFSKWRKKRQAAKEAEDARKKIEEERKNAEKVRERAEEERKKAEKARERAREKAEEARKKAEEEKEKAAEKPPKMHKGKLVDPDESPDLLEDLGKPVVLPEPPKIHEGKKVDPDEAPDLLDDLMKPKEDLGDHKAPKHKPEAATADLLEAARLELAEKIAAAAFEVDEAPDLAEPRKGEETEKAKKKKVKPEKAKKEKKPKQKKPRPKKEEAKKEEDEYEVKLDVNLVPHEVKKEFKQKNRLAELVLIIFAFVILVGAAYTGLRWYEKDLNAQTQGIQLQTDQVNADIARYTGLRRDAGAVNERLDGVAEVLERHVYWTPLLELVEDQTLPTVYYRSISGSADTGVFSFDVVATDYAQVEPQVRLYRESSFVKSVNTSSAVQFTVAEDETTAEESTTDEEAAAGSAKNKPAETRVNFSMSIEFEPALFNHPRLATQQ